MDWLKVIADKKTELNDLFTRMDADRDMAYAKPYIMKGANKRPVKGVANVTLPEAKAFLAKCVAKLSLVERQTTVESESLTDKKTTKIEEYLEDVDFEADNLLSRKGEKDEMSHLAEHVCLRGPIAEQILLKTEGDNLIPDIRMLDTRYLLYDLDSTGVTWGAPIMTRSALDIEREFGVKIGGKTAEVIDCWDENEEAVFINGKLFKTNPNTYGFPPFVAQRPACGSSLRDKDSLKYQAVSIFYYLQDDEGNSLFDEANFIASILKTMTYDLTKPALQYKSDAGENKEIEEYPGDPGSVSPTEKGGGFDLVPKRDMTNAARYYKQIIDINKQIATYSILDFGSTTFPLSAIAMTKLSEAKGELLMHRLNAIAYLRQQRARMIINEFPRGRILKLGEEGHKRSYKSSDLDGDYTVKYRFWTASKEDMASDAAIVNALRGEYSDDTLRRDILKVKNPDLEAQKIQSEALERENPIIRMYRQLHALIDQAEIKPQKDIEARIVLDKVVNLIKRTKLDEQVPLANEPNQRQPVPNSNPLIPLFANNGNVGQSQQEAVNA